MYKFTDMELEEALKSIKSSLAKSEKAQLKLKPETWQYKLMTQGIKTYKVSIELIERELKKNIEDNELLDSYTKEDIENILQFILSTISKVEKVMPKFKPGTSQHTLSVRRIKAFNIARELIQQNFIF